MSNVGKLYHWGNFLKEHYYSIMERHNNKNKKKEVIDYLWKWFNGIL